MGTRKHYPGVGSIHNERSHIIIFLINWLTSLSNLLSIVETCLDDLETDPCVVLSAQCSDSSASAHCDLILD